jgi:Adenylate cyclase, family 3 (some proteins contain HAMP domain)
VGPIEAVLYWVDLTGFTALTEQLQRQGRRGAEELSTWMERWFFPLEDRLHRLGGRVLLSGGDGLVAALPPSLPRDDLLALLADTHDRLSHWEGPTLQIKQALHRGRIYPVPLPDLPDRMLFTGPVLQTLARRVEHIAFPQTVGFPGGSGNPEGAQRTLARASALHLDRRRPLALPAHHRVLPGTAGLVSPTGSADRRTLVAAHVYPGGHPDQSAPLGGRVPLARGVRIPADAGRCRGTGADPGA